MNLLVVFQIILLAIVVFFILYCIMYKRLEGFQCQHDPALAIPLTIAELNEGSNACLNNIVTLIQETLLDGDVINMYELNGTHSNIYIRDYYDSFFDLSFAIKFKDLNNCTIIDTKHIKVYLSDGSLKVSKNSVEHTFNKISLAINTLYVLKLNNDKTIKKNEILFGNHADSDNDLDIKTFTEENMCNFSVGNDIHIGSNKTETSFMNGFIGDIQLNINKSKWDMFDLDKTLTIPTQLVCELDEVIEVELPNSYITIRCDLILQDLQRKFKSTINEDRITGMDNIYSFFSSLTDDKQIFRNFKETKLYKDLNTPIFKDEYHTYNVSSPDIYYMFSYKINTTIMNTFNFLDQSRIHHIDSHYDQVYIFIYGERTRYGSIYKFLRLQKPIFIIVYKNETDSMYYFEPIKMNLDNFYEYHKEFSIANTDYKTFFDNKSVQNIDVAYKPNVFRLYNDKLDVGDINVTIYENDQQKETLLVRYKQDQIDEVCTFTAKGETKFDCIQSCNEFSTGCTTCETLCNSCDTNQCKWNLLDINMKHRLSPSEIRVKAFAGDKTVKLTWIKPLSPYTIEKYYIMGSSVLNTHFDLYVYEGIDTMIDFFISGLTNDIPYSFYVFSKNKVGISEPSNIATVIPKRNKLLKMENVSKNTFSDSLQNYYNMDTSGGGNSDILIDFDNTISNMNMLEDVNKLKDILVNKITENKLSSDAKINIF